MPTATTEEAEPLLTRMARAAFETRVLRELSEAPNGLLRRELLARFPVELAAQVESVVDHLVDSDQVSRYPGLVFHIAERGRSRIGPPVCVSGRP